MNWRLHVAPLLASPSWDALLASADQDRDNKQNDCGQEHDANVSDDTSALRACFRASADAILTGALCRAANYRVPVQEGSELDRELATSRGWHTLLRDDASIRALLLERVDVDKDARVANVRVLCSKHMPGLRRLHDALLGIETAAEELCHLRPGLEVPWLRFPSHPHAIERSCANTLPRPVALERVRAWLRRLPPRGPWPADAAPALYVTERAALDGLCAEKEQDAKKGTAEELLHYFAERAPEAPPPSLAQRAPSTLPPAARVAQFAQALRADLTRLLARVPLPVLAQPRTWVVVDNSNLELGARAVVGAHLGIVSRKPASQTQSIEEREQQRERERERETEWQDDARPRFRDPSIRLHFGALHAALVDQQTEFVCIVGSVPPSESVWKAMTAPFRKGQLFADTKNKDHDAKGESAALHLILCSRSRSGRENQNDLRIQQRLHELPTWNGWDARVEHAAPCRLVLVTGDRALHAAAYACLRAMPTLTLELWSWNGATATAAHPPDLASRITARVFRLAPRVAPLLPLPVAHLDDRIFPDLLYHSLQFAPRQSQRQRDTPNSVAPYAVLLTPSAQNKHTHLHVSTLWFWLQYQCRYTGTYWKAMHLSPSAGAAGEDRKAGGAGKDPLPGAIVLVHETMRLLSRDAGETADVYARRANYARMVASVAERPAPAPCRCAQCLPFMTSLFPSSSSSLSSSSSTSKAASPAPTTKAVPSAPISSAAQTPMAHPPSQPNAARKRGKRAKEKHAKARAEARAETKNAPKPVSQPIPDVEPKSETAPVPDLKADAKNANADASDTFCHARPIDYFCRWLSHANALLVGQTRIPSWSVQPLDRAPAVWRAHWATHFAQRQTFLATLPAEPAANLQLPLAPNARILPPTRAWDDTSFSAPIVTDAWQKY
jgi:hypothetical protein